MKHSIPRDRATGKYKTQFITEPLLKQDATPMPTAPRPGYSPPPVKRELKMADDPNRTVMLSPDEMRKLADTLEGLPSSADVCRTLRKKADELEA